MKTLVIFEHIPEHTDFYLFDKTESILDEVRKISNLFQNGDDLSTEQEEAFEKLSDWLATKEKESTPIHAEINEVIHCGWFM